MTDNNVYKFIQLAITIIATFWDFFRVTVFNKNADNGFLAVTFIVEVCLIVNIFANYMKTKYLSVYMFQENGFAELTFVLCNLFSCSLLSENSFLIFITANFFKIVNAMRVSDILHYL
jgi:hypothetical protein